MRNNSKSAKRVLIYRLGSIGDTVVALPCFRLIARVFSNAERRVLTNFTDGAKVAAIDTVIGPMNLVHGYFRYPLNTRNLRTLWRLLRQIRSWNPDVLVYLVASRGRVKAFRDAFFFKTCGISKLIGIPWHQDRQCIRKPADNNELWESEACRMARCIAKLGDAGPNDSESYDLKLTLAERQKAEKELEGWRKSGQFIAAGIGTKADTKDWGQENWKSLFDKWSMVHPAVGLVLVGSADENEISEKVAATWKGSWINLCGKLTPRETAAVLERATLFVGHDSGPMHLAASVGTPCIAIFSARNKPGEWYPFGNQHRVIYHQIPCYGCNLVVCERFDKMCIRSITVEEVCVDLDEVWWRIQKNGRP
ncbi:MAG: glycosyltransferase family 9 protein [Gammaproteobacteria bacterium]